MERLVILGRVLLLLLLSQVLVLVMLVFVRMCERLGILPYEVLELGFLTLKGWGCG
jgi:hypothetical protein